MITLLALTMDPFVQQVISFDSRPVHAGNMSSSISTARIYDTNARREDSTDAAQHSVYSRLQKSPKISKA
jgi:hypothetical protein